jgi:lipid A disaccharide synthetase
LVNLILNGPAIPELIQGNLKAEYIIDCLKSILPGGPNHEDQLEISDLVREKLGDAKVSNVLAGLITSRLDSLG